MSLACHVVLSEFDIDKGSTFRAAVPTLPPWVNTPALAERQLPEGSHHRAAETTMWLVADGEDAAALPLRFINVCRTVLKPGLRRGADVKAVAIATRWHGADTLQPLVAAAVDAVFAAAPSNSDGGDGVEAGGHAWWVPVLTQLHAAFSALDVATCVNLSRLHRAVLRGLLPIAGKSLSAVKGPPLSQAFRAVVSRGVGPSSAGDGADGSDAAAAAVALWDYETTVPWLPAGAQARVRLRLPLFVEPTTFPAASLAALVRRFGTGVLRIYNAVLQQKRIVFLGTRDVAAVDVVTAVLACAHMVCPPLPDITPRLFPYANLTDLSFLAVPGFIAGVTNPLFEGKTEWWDVLCVLEACDCEGLAMPAGSGLVPGTLAHVSINAPAPDHSTAAPSAAATAATAVAGTRGADAAGEEGPGDAAPTTGGGGGAGRRSTVSTPTAHAKHSRVVLSSPAVFAPNDRDITASSATISGVARVATSAGRDTTAVVAASATITTTSAPASSPTAASTASMEAYQAYDDMFYDRMVGGLKHGEHWIRHAFEQYTASLLALMATAQEQAHTGTSTPAASNTPAGSDQGAWSPTAVATSPPQGVAPTDSGVPGVATLPPLATIPVTLSKQQAHLLEGNQHRLAAIRSSAAYAAFLHDREEEEEWLRTSSSAPEPTSPLTLPAAVDGAGSPGTGPNGCNPAELKALARVLRQPGRMWGVPWLEEGEAGAEEAKGTDVAGGQGLPLGWPVPDFMPEGVSSSLHTLGTQEWTRSETAELAARMAPCAAPLAPSPSSKGATVSTALCRDLSHVDVAALPLLHPLAIFMRLAHHLRFPSAQLYFLTLFPDAAGGLHPIAMGLLHADARVRRLANHILHGFELHPWLPVRQAVLSLNPALQAARSLA